MLRFMPKLNFPHAWNLAFWNALFILVALLLITIVGEVYLRLTIPFMRSSQVMKFVPGVGLLYKPNTMIYATNGVDFWVKSKVNSIGFLERESRTTERPEGCHIAFIGDSFVEGREVRLADRFSVLMEDLAKEELPDLGITTSAFGRRSTGQIHQIPYYDRFARKMNPDLLILVFVANDFLDNSSFLHYLYYILSPWDPDHPPDSYALKSKQGEIFLYPPDPEFQKYSIIFPPSNPMIDQINIFPNTFFGSWLSLRLKRVLLSYMLHYVSRNERLTERVNALRDRPQYAALTVDWKPLTWGKILRSFEQNKPIKALQNSLDFTAFSLDQFKARADQDGVSLAILATDSMSTLRMNLSKGIEGRAPIDSLREMAVTRGIPVIDMYDYLVRQGRRVEDSIAAMHFERDPHWNEVGHRIAAEAVLEYLKENTRVCETRDAIETVP